MPVMTIWVPVVCTLALATPVFGVPKELELVLLIGSLLPITVLLLELLPSLAMGPVVRLLLPSLLHCRLGLG